MFVYWTGLVGRRVVLRTKGLKYSNRVCNALPPLDFFFFFNFLYGWIEGPLALKQPFDHVTVKLSM